MIIDIECFQMRTIKISGEQFEVYKFKKEGTYTDGNNNKYVCYSTVLNDNLVTFLKNDYCLICTHDKDYFVIEELKKGDLDFYSWDIVTV